MGRVEPSQPSLTDCSGGLSDREKAERVKSVATSIPGSTSSSLGRPDFTPSAPSAQSAEVDRGGWANTTPVTTMGDRNGRKDFAHGATVKGIEEGSKIGATALASSFFGVSKNWLYQGVKIAEKVSVEPSVSQDKTCEEHGASAMGAVIASARAANSMKPK